MVHTIIFPWSVFFDFNAFSFLGETEKLVATVDDKVLSKCVTIYPVSFMSDFLQFDSH